MRGPVHRGWAIAAVLLTMAVASAAEAQVITLDDVLTSVQRHHPKLLSAGAKVDAARGDRVAAEGAFDLKVAGTGEVIPIGKEVYGTTDLKVEQPTTIGGARFYGGWSWGGRDIPLYYGELLTPAGGKLKAGATVPVWRGRDTDEARAGLATADIELEIVSAGAALARLDLVRDAALAWSKWVSAGLKFAIADEMLALAQDRDEGVARQVEAGKLAPVERLDNQRAIATRRREQAEAERDLQVAAVKLGLYLRDEGGRPVRIDVARLPRELPALEPGYTLEQALARARELRPELRVMERVRAGLLVERELADNQLAPQLDLGVGVEQGLADDGAVLGATEVHTTVTFSLPVQQRKARGKLMALDAKLDALERDRQWLSERVEAEVQQAWTVHEIARERLELAEQEVDLAGQAALAERKLFEAGSSTLLKVNLREEYLATARKKLVEARAEALEAWLAVEVAAGAPGLQVP